jgi:tetratricopeptide (TPR) repeat protein
MRLGLFLGFLLCWTVGANLFAQTDYNAYYQEMNPAHDSLSTEEKLVVIQDFLDNALVGKDTVAIIHGNLYFANIFSRKADFSGTIDSFAIANAYYQLAIPIIEKHASKNSLAVSLANYGNVLSHQDSVEAAISSYQQALALNTELGDLYQTSPCLTSIADQYRKLGRYQEALSLYYQAVKIDRDNGWMYFLYLDYYGLATIHEELAQFDSAVYYHRLYEHLSWEQRF